MSHPVIPIAATLALGAGPLMFARSFRDLRLRRLIQNTPNSRIRSMPMGMVEFHGTVIARNQVYAPFSGRKCAFWQVEIASHGGRDQWKTVHRNISGHPFYVDDGTGLALIYPQGADCKVAMTSEEQCNGLALPECYSRYMSEQHLSMRYLWRLSGLRFRERTIDEGDPVYVLGTAVPRPPALEVSGLQIDEPPDDKHQRLEELHQRTLAVVRQGEGNRAFIISQESELQLTFDLGFRALAELIGGPALTLLGLGYWLMSGGSWTR